MDRRKGFYVVMWTVGLSSLMAFSVQAQVLLNDPLNGSTVGTRSGGTFVAGGWRVDNQYDSIYWHVPTVSHGAFEFNVKGLPANSCPGGAGGKSEISHMYDYTWNNADNQYAPGYRDDPFKQYLRKQCEAGKENRMEILWAIDPNFLEDDTPALSWDVNTNYLFRNEWENIGGNANMKTYRDGVLIWTQTIPGSWNPAGQSIRIAASSRRADEGATTGAVYSNVKYYDLTNFIPVAPAVTTPNNGETVNTKVVYVQWSPDSHTQYQVRINIANDPNSGTVWDSQQVTSTRNFTWTGTLNDLTTYYVFVRLGGTGGWGPWSANGRTFTVNTSFVPSGTDYVRVNGNSYRNFSGPFLGLGATYMRGLRNCKYDRVRYQNDCAFLASKQFNYIRILTMVDWQGLEIAPVSFGSIPAWPDYWQQFRDCIDVAYSYGLKTEVTIFAGAQGVMPSDSTRMAHLDNILANIVGREHKIVLLEIANEYWQNGFPDPGGVADVRSKAQYLADRTIVPVALSSPSDTSDAGIVAMNGGSAADISVVHFDRNIGTVEGGWLPVRDSYRTGVAGIAPMSSNEPIGAGSSVSSENDPIKLCMAAVFAYVAGLPSYVYHSRAGTFGWELCCPAGGQEKFFSASPGVDSYQNILPLLPKELASWERNDGKVTASPFTSYSMGQANKWWTEVGGSTNGCVRNISTIKSGRFVTCPIGILSGGLELEARRPMTFKVYNPLTGSVDYNLTKNPGDHFTLAQGTGAYVIIGDFTDVPIDGGSGTGIVSIDLGTANIESGMTHPQPGDGDTTAANIGGRDCRRNLVNTSDNYFYFAVSDGYAFQGNKPNQNFRVDYYDTGTATLTLQYDGTAAAYVTGPTVTLTNTNTWKTVIWNVTNAYFGNRQNNGADFRIAAPSGVTFYIDKVSVYQKAFSGTPVSIPGTVQAEDYDNGGEGVAYHDLDTTNNGGAYRPGEGVDIEVTSDTGGGFNVGWLNTTEYLTYQVNVTTAGSYDFRTRVASGMSTGQYHIEMNGTNVSGTRTVTSTGGIQTWADNVVSNVTLPAGGYTMKVVVDNGNGNWNLNYIAIEKHQGPFGGTARAIPGTIQAEDFDDGGAEVAYHDLDVPNNGASYRTAEQVDIEPCTDTGGGFNIGWTGTGEWLEYTVNVNQTGDYAIKVRVASAGSGGSFHFSIDGTNITTAKSFTGTGGWQTWTTIIIPGVFLPAGTNKVLRLTADTSDYNVNSIDFVFGGSDVVSEDLDTTNSDDGMTHPQAGDGDTVAATIGGHYCRQNLNPAQDFYMYFGVFDSYTLNGNFPAATISIDYFDNGTGNLNLQYDGAGSPYTAGPTIVRTNTNTWKQFTFNVNDAYFGNRQNSGADFRIAAPVGDTFYIDTVMVYTSLASTPGPATGPSPANAATGVAINASLSWTAGSGATSHDVRFGTTNPPPFIQNQAGTSYTPPTMTPNTMYFWRIDEKNSSGTTTGTVWSFTTLPLPGLASVPSPANAATGVAINASLSWTAGSNATSHDVRFGTTNPPAFVQNQAGTSYTPPTMTPNTTYFWRIDEKNSSGTTTGTVWSFSTLPLPGLASVPSPANGATGVATNATLSWTAGSNATSHDVRFGTTNPPPFIQNQAGTTYNPGALTGSTTYFWRIDEKNSSGTTTGTVWSFTTAAGGPPGLATNPNPASGATGFGVDANLSWTAGSGATSHDVRFGTANPPPFIQNQAGTTYDPGTMAASTTYFWRIDEKNGNGTTTGTVWSFTTAAAPAAPTVTGPTNGSTITSLTPTITWTGAAHDQYQVRVSQVNDSNTSTNGWDSGAVTNTGNSAVSGALRDYSLYFVFVRLHTAVGGWGGWSANGYYFITTTNSVGGTVYLGISLPTSNGWTLTGTQSWENDGVDIQSSFPVDGGSNVWKIIDNATNKRSKLKYSPAGHDISFNTGATIAARMRATGLAGATTYNLCITNGNVGGMCLRLDTTQVSLVDITGVNRGSFALDATQYHKYQMSVKNTTNGNNATAAWKVYVDGTQRITWTGAGVHDGYDGFMMGNESAAATGTWWFDWTAARNDGEFSPAQWDPLN